jgi:hypothetical protein
MPEISDSTKQHRKKEFLKALVAGYSVTGAAHLAKADRTTMYRWRNDDPEFRSAWEDAWESRGDWYEDQNRAAALELSMPAILNGLKMHGRVTDKVTHASDPANPMSLLGDLSQLNTILSDPSKREALIEVARQRETK